LPPHNTLQWASRLLQQATAVDALVYTSMPNSSDVAATTLRQHEAGSVSSMSVLLESTDLEAAMHSKYNGMAQSWVWPSLMASLPWTEIGLVCDGLKQPCYDTLKQSWPARLQQPWCGGNKCKLSSNCHQSINWSISLHFLSLWLIQGVNRQRLRILRMNKATYSMLFWATDKYAFEASMWL